LVGSVLTPSPDDFVARDEMGAVLSPVFVAAAVAQARRYNRSVVFFHSHPFSEYASFSKQDDAGEVVLAEFLRRRIPNQLHAAVVIGRAGHAARLLGTSRACTLDVVGSRILRWSPTSGEAELSGVPVQYDRQVRVFGPEAQRRLRGLRVAIVGVGGTGSCVAQQLAHLGIRDFVLLDPDVLEDTNLNRVIGSEPADVGSRKVAVVSRLIKRINPDAKIEASAGSVLLQDEARRLTCVDAVFGCTDSHGSRHVLNQVAYQFVIPLFDVGVTIAVEGERISHIFGRAQMLAPGLPCLTCTRLLDPEEVRRDLMSDFERKRDPYVIGAAAPQPAVVSLNNAVSSLAVTMFLSAFAGVPVAVRHQLFDATRGVVRPITDRVMPTCITCSSDGAFAQGDEWPMPGRRG
jgi:molybdopterin/thiamine biosynthesis adenylyltransferase